MLHEYKTHRIPITISVFHLKNNDADSQYICLSNFYMERILRTLQKFNINQQGLFPDLHDMYWLQNMFMPNFQKEVPVPFPTP